MGKNHTEKHKTTIHHIPISGIPAIVLVALFVILWTSNCSRPSAEPTRTTTPMTRKPQQTPATATLTSTRVRSTSTIARPTRFPSQTPPPILSPTPPAPPLRPSPTVIPQDPVQRPVSQWYTIGQSVQERDISAAIVGYEKGSAVVVVGSIQGDQLNTRDLVKSLIDDFDRERGGIPENVAFHFIPTINPDGNEAGTRRNANDVDLNRNWDTFDWTPDPQQPEGIVEGAGGTAPLSEPETQSLAKYLLTLQDQNPNLRVAVWHTSVRIESGGQIYPGYTSDKLDQGALDLAWRYADVTGYAVQDAWEPYETTGELIAWCAEQGIETIDIFIPDSLSGFDRDLRYTTMKALLEIAQFPVEFSR